MQSRTFVIKDNQGVIYNFYTPPTGGIYYKLYSLHNNQKIDPFEISVTDEKVLDFYVNIDIKDNLHIICLTEKGHLKYFFNNENLWESKTFSQFDLSSNIIKSLFIHVDDKKLYITYAASNIMNTNLWTIYFKYWDNIKWNNMNVGITICDKNSQPYYIILDNQDNFHIIYKSSSNKGTQLFYRKFHAHFSLWSTAEKVINSNELITFYYLFCDSNNYLHLTWITTTGINFKLLYKKLNTKILNNKHLDRSLTLNTSTQPYAQPVIFEIDKKIWVMCKNQDTFSASEIDRFGLSSSVELPIQHPDSSKCILVEFINNHAIEKQSFYGKLFYAAINDFVDLILPESYLYDFNQDIVYESQQTNCQDSLSLNTPKDIIEKVAPIEKRCEINKKVNISGCDNITDDIVNKEVMETPENIKSQSHDSNLTSVLNKIKEQNLILTGFINKLTEQQENNDSKKDKGVFKKFLSIFK